MGRDPSVLVNTPQADFKFGFGWTRGPAGVFIILVPYPDFWWYLVSTRDETFRAVLPVRTPDGERATVIVTRQGLGSSGRIWITFSGGWVTTAVMSDEEAERFVGLLVRREERERRVGENAAVGDASGGAGVVMVRREPFWCSGAASV